MVGLPKQGSSPAWRGPPPPPGPCARRDSQPQTSRISNLPRQGVRKHLEVRIWKGIQMHLDPALARRRDLNLKNTSRADDSGFASGDPSDSHDPPPTTD